MDDLSVVKVFTVKDGAHHYYVQEMPLPWSSHRCYRVMKDRRILFERTYDKREDAIKRLLWELTAQYGLQVKIPGLE